ncbi:MAG TPA: hypothetical protein VGI52_05395 [Solirubrobacteraceae bacterium]
MPSHRLNTHRAGPAHARRAGVWLLSISVAGLLAAVPSASAVSPTDVTLPSAPSITPVAVTLDSGDLASLDIGALGLQPNQLASALAQIPALGALPAGTLESVTAALPSNTPLSGLLSAIELATGIKVSVGEVTQVVVGDPSADSSVLTGLLADAASQLQGTPQGAQLAQLLENLLAGLSPDALQQLAGQLGIGGNLAELASTLEQKLAKDELLPALESLLSQLGTPIATTAGQLEGTLGTTPAALANELGLPESLLNTLTGVETPIGGTGGLLTALAGQNGTTLGTVPGASTSTTNNSTTNNSTSTTMAPATAATAKKVAAGKVKILSHKVKGHTLTLVLQTPSAGQITVTAAHAKRVSKKVAKAMTTTLKVPLTKAGIAATKGRRKLNVKVKVAFKPTSGASSSAAAQARFS